MLRFDLFLDDSKWRQHAESFYSGSSSKYKSRWEAISRRNDKLNFRPKEEKKVSKSQEELIHLCRMRAFGGIDTKKRQSEERRKAKSEKKESEEKRDRKEKSEKKESEEKRDDKKKRVRKRRVKRKWENFLLTGQRFCSRPVFLTLFCRIMNR